MNQNLKKIASGLILVIGLILFFSSLLNNNLNPNNIINSELENFINRDQNNFFLREILENSFDSDKNQYKKILSEEGEKQLKKIQTCKFYNLHS